MLYLGNLYSLIIALLDKVNSMSSAVSTERNQYEGKEYIIYIYKDYSTYLCHLGPSE